MINFHSISLEDIPQMHAWFNEAHVQRFYSLWTWSEMDVLNKLVPIINRENRFMDSLLNWTEPL